MAFYWILDHDGKTIWSKTETSSFESAADNFAFTYRVNVLQENKNPELPPLPPSIIVAKRNFLDTVKAMRFVAYRALDETYGHDKERYLSCGPVSDTDLRMVSSSVRRNGDSHSIDKC